MRGSAREGGEDARSGGFFDIGERLKQLSAKATAWNG